MGAIGGIINLEGAPVVRARLEDMQGELARYGADSQSIRISGSVGMLSCRLTITAEDRHDRQPLESEGSQASQIVAFDGRLDNRDELQVWLGLDSATVDQMADSAIVQAALARDSGEALPLDLLLLTPAIKDVWQSRESVNWEGGLLRVVSRDGLIKLKILRNSGQDRDDIKHLENL